MKIKEITENFTVKQNTPQQGLVLAAPDGTQITIPPEKMTALQADPSDPNKFSLNAQAMQATSAPNEPAGPKVGATVDLPPELSQNTMGGSQQQQQQQQQQSNVGSEQTMGETHNDDDDESEYEKEENDLIGSGKDGDIGGSGDKTDDLISSVQDKRFTRHARGAIAESKKSKVAKLAEDDELARWLTIARLR